MRLHEIWIAGSAFGCKGVIVVVRHLPRPPHRAASAALVRACLIHVGGAPQPPFHRLSAPMLPFSIAVHWLALRSTCQTSRIFSFVSPPWPITWPWFDALAFLHWTHPAPQILGLTGFLDVFVMSGKS